MKIDSATQTLATNQLKSQSVNAEPAKQAASSEEVPGETENDSDRDDSSTSTNSSSSVNSSGGSSDFSVVV